MNPIKSAKEFVRLRQSEIMEEYNQANYAPIPDNVCIEIINEHPDYKEWLVANPTVSSIILEALMNDPDWRVRHYIADHPNITPAICEKLSTDIDEGIRHRIAFNIKTPLVIVKRLMDDPWRGCAESAKRRYEERIKNGEHLSVL